MACRMQRLTPRHPARLLRSPAAARGVSAGGRPAAAQRLSSAPTSEHMVSLWQSLGITASKQPCSLCLQHVMNAVYRQACQHVVCAAAGHLDQADHDAEKTVLYGPSNHWFPQRRNYTCCASQPNVMWQGVEHIYIPAKSQ